MKKAVGVRKICEHHADGTTLCSSSLDSLRIGVIQALSTKQSGLKVRRLLEPRRGFDPRSATTARIGIHKPRGVSTVKSDLDVQSTSLDFHLRFLPSADRAT